MALKLGVTYVLHPGPVYSIRDGQHHHVGFAELALLYGVQPAACLQADPYRRLEGERYVHLYPDPTGSYQIPKGRGKK